MKKGAGLFFLTLVFILIMAAVSNADTGSERTWCFQNSEFSSLQNEVFTEDKTINGLTLSSGIEMRSSKCPVKTLYFTRDIYTKSYGSKNDGYVKFHVNGPTDIHILGRSKSNDESRDVSIYSSADGETNSLTMGVTADDYVYQYRGAAGDIYLYTNNMGVRILSITAKDYIESEYAPLGENERRVWDFENYEEYSGVISQDTDIDNMHIKADEANTLTIGFPDGQKEPYGCTQSTYIDLGGRVRYEGRYITFPVNRNSDIYITARAVGISSGRNLLIWNKYFGTPKTSLQNNMISVNDGLITYKISYYGDGEDLLLGSDNSGIRIYKISVVPRINKVVDYNKWDIANNSSFAVGDYTDTNINGLNIINCAIENTAETGNQNAVHLRSKVFGNGGMLKFKVSDSTKPRGAAIKRTIKIKAKSAYTNNELVKLIVVNSEKNVLWDTNLNNDIQEYSFEYNGSYDDLYVYSYYPHNEVGAGAYIYSVDNGVTGVVGPEDMKRTISVTKGQQYQYYFTADNIDADAYTYKISYNKDALTPKYIGYGDGNDTYSTGDINIIKNTNGELIYTINNKNSNWSGTTVSVIFEAKSTGNTVLEYIAEPIS